MNIANDLDVAWGDEEAYAMCCAAELMRDIDGVYGRDGGAIIRLTTTSTGVTKPCGCGEKCCS